MKNRQTNGAKWGSLLAIALAAVTGFSMAACSNGGDSFISPEDKPVAERWSLYAHPSSTATITYSVAEDGLCTITVGGTAVPPLNASGGNSGDVSYWHSVWYANASYQYTARAGKKYSYKFEAWTDGAERALVIQWYNDNENAVYQTTGYEDTTHNPPSFKITSQHKEYTITATEPIPKSGVQNLEFQCANQIGTFYVKILEIKQL